MPKSLNFCDRQELHLLLVAFSSVIAKKVDGKENIIIIGLGKKQEDNCYLPPTHPPPLVQKTEDRFVRVNTRGCRGMDSC